MAEKQLFEGIQHFLAFGWLLDALVIDHRVGIDQVNFAFVLLLVVDCSIDLLRDEVEFLGDVVFGKVGV